MADRLEFKEKLAGILALAEGQNGKITVDEVEKYFEEDGLSQEQMNLVCDYLLSMKMAVVGYKQTGGTVKEDEKEEKQPLSAEEQKYVEEYLRGLTINQDGKETAIKDDVSRYCVLDKDNITMICGMKNKDDFRGGTLYLYKDGKIVKIDEEVTSIETAVKRYDKIDLDYYSMQ